ncbi:MAG: hypothetical protein K8F62_14620 [Pseudorhodoplanes sp.]|nr:hypothetical protein [Pseudorhodoplanes sp.]
MNSVTSYLVKHGDVIFVAYAITFVALAWFWFRTQHWSLEVALSIISMAIMPAIYLGMIFWDAKMATILAPQYFLLPLLGCGAIWPLVKRSEIVPLLIALSFLINAAGYAWTRTILHATGKF